MMRPSGWLLLTQLSICCALGASAVLYVHYLNPVDSEFCGLRSGCEAVRRSGLSYFFGSRFVSLPLFAMLAFSGLLGLSLRLDAGQPPGGRVTGLGGLWHHPELSLFTASGVGAVLALALIAYQLFVLGQYCWLCLIVNVATLVAAASAFFLARLSAASGTRGNDPRGSDPGSDGSAARSPLRAAAWVAIGGLLIAGPLVWNAVRPPAPVPSRIQALYEPGKINVVEFADFECPFCRRLHHVLGPLVTEYGDQVHFVRAHRPLDQHPNAEAAARAALCAEAQGQGDAMSERLFSEELSPETISAAAHALRLDPAGFDACMAAETTSKRLAEDAALLPDEELQGLPTTYVGSQRFIGVPTEVALRDAFERAKRPPAHGPSGPLYVAVLGILIGLVCFFGRRQS
jgi:protein-disulfide isomerase/uncharacterized membrane protein